MLIPPRPGLAEIAAIYFKIGSTAFGGPAAQLAMIEDELVQRRGWVSPERFVDFLGVSSLIPGPSSTQTGLFIAREVRGIPGLVTAGIAFIGPAATLTVLLTWAYTQFGAVPAFEGPFTGIKAAILAVIFTAVLRLGKKAFSSALTWGIGVAACGAVISGLPEIPVLLGGGGLGALLGLAGRATAGTKGDEGGRGDKDGEGYEGDAQRPSFLPLWGATALVAATPAAAAPMALFWYFLKVGAFLYGGGYVLIAFLQGGLVGEMGWLTEAQLLDAIAIGQITPGPLFTISTAVGFLAAGWWGALAATVGIFLPGMFFVGLAGPWIQALRRSPLASAALSAIGAAAVGIMAAVLLPLAKSSIYSIPTAAIAVAAAVAALRWKLSAVWIVLGGALLGLGIELIGA